MNCGSPLNLCDGKNNSRRIPSTHEINMMYSIITVNNSVVTVLVIVFVCVYC